jgi:hypothetical protein
MRMATSCSLIGSSRSHHLSILHRASRRPTIPAAELRSRSCRPSAALNVTSLFQAAGRGMAPPIVAMVEQVGKIARELCEARLNIRAVWHLDEFVARNARAVRRDHLFPADLTVRRVVIARVGFVVRNFIQRPTVGAFKGLSHPANIPCLRALLLALPNTS